jgi:hypothetical protein
MSFVHVWPAYQLIIAVWSFDKKVGCLCFREKTKMPKLGAVLTVNGRTPWKRLHHFRLRVLQIVKELPASYGSQTFCAVFINATTNLFRPIPIFITTLIFHLHQVLKTWSINITFSDQSSEYFTILAARTNGSQVQKM